MCSFWCTAAEGKHQTFLKQAEITPSFKKGHADFPSSPRPLIATISKLFGEVVNAGIYKFKQREPFSGSNIAWLPLKKTQKNSVLTETVRNKVDGGGSVDVIVSVLWKASEKISQEVDVLRFESLLFDSNAVTVLPRFLSGLIENVVLLSWIWIELYQCVAQGTTLSLILFIVYIDRVEQWFRVPLKAKKYGVDNFLVLESRLQRRWKNLNFVQNA